MPKLTRDQKRARDAKRFAERVLERRAAGKDVVAYALGCARARQFLTDDERILLNARIEMRRKRLALKDDLDHGISQIRLNAFKEGIDPFGVEAAAAIAELRAEFSLRLSDVSGLTAKPLADVQHHQSANVVFLHAWKSAK